MVILAVLCAREQTAALKAQDGGTGERVLSGVRVRRGEGAPWSRTSSPHNPATKQSSLLLASLTFSKIVCSQLNQHGLEIAQFAQNVIAEFCLCVPKRHVSHI